MNWISVDTRKPKDRGYYWGWWALRIVEVYWGGKFFIFWPPKKGKKQILEPTHWAKRSPPLETAP